MVEYHGRTEKTDPRVRQVQIIGRRPLQLGLDKVLEVVPPKTKTATQWKRKIDLVQHFVTGHQFIKNVPGIAVPFDRAAASRDNGSSAERTERKKRPGRH